VIETLGFRNNFFCLGAVDLADFGKGYLIPDGAKWLSHYFACTGEYLLKRTPLKIRNNKKKPKKIEVVVGQKASSTRKCVRLLRENFYFGRVPKNPNICLFF